MGRILTESAISEMEMIGHNMSKSAMFLLIRALALPVVFLHESGNFNLFLRRLLPLVGPMFLTTL